MPCSAFSFPRNRAVGDDGGMPVHAIPSLRFLLWARGVAASDNAGITGSTVRVLPQSCLSGFPETLCGVDTVSAINTVPDTMFATPAAIRVAPDCLDN